MKIEFAISNLTKNCNETLILSLLMTDNKHGYQLALEIEENSGGYFKFNHGTLYPILHKLEKEGLIKGIWKNEGPKIKRKYYYITNKGKDYCSAQKTEWENFYSNFKKITGENQS